MLVRLAIDFENSARRWWDGGGRELWESIALDADSSHVELDEALARSWLEQARLVDGWDEGPDYAPHPIVLQPVADDEDVPV